MSGMRRTCRICAAAQRPLSVYGKQDVLLKLHSPLLYAADAGKDSHGHALQRTADDFPSSLYGSKTSHMLKNRKEKDGKTMKKAVFICLGCICFVLGTTGVFLPVLPTVPFYMCTVFFFANSSQKLHDWFIITQLYHKHLESYMKKEGMTVKTKISVIATVTVLMGFGFIMMARKEIWIPCLILAAVWVGHIIYFVFAVKTISQEQ